MSPFRNSPIGNRSELLLHSGSTSSWSKLWSYHTTSPVKAMNAVLQQLPTLLPPQVSPKDSTSPTLPTNSLQLAIEELCTKLQSDNSNLFLIGEFLKGLAACLNAVGSYSPVEGRIVGATYDLRASWSYLWCCCFPCVPNLSQQAKVCVN